jgi:hypothetical protein
LWKYCCNELGLAVSVLDSEASGFFFGVDKVTLGRNAKGILSMFCQIGGDLGLDKTSEAQKVEAMVAKHEIHFRTACSLYPILFATTLL